jgi:hypothetical protein
MFPSLVDISTIVIYGLLDFENLSMGIDGHSILRWRGKGVHLGQAVWVITVLKQVKKGKSFPRKAVLYQRKSRLWFFSSELLGYSMS